MGLAALGGVGVGLVVGWLLPIVWQARWQSVLASAGTIAIVLAVLFGLAGIWGSVGALIGIAMGAWLHGAFLEHVAARTTQPKET